MDQPRECYGTHDTDGLQRFHCPQLRGTVPERTLHACSQLSMARPPHRTFFRWNVPSEAADWIGVGTHRPLKLATRRSSVALTPSLKSSVARRRVCSASSWLVAAKTRSARLPRIVARVEIRPSGEHSA